MRYGLQSAEELGVHDAAKALKRIADRLERWSAHFNGLRVYSVDEDARIASMSEDFREHAVERYRDAVEGGVEDP